MCVVRYSDYGNEEEQYLTDLMSSTMQEQKTGTYSYQVYLLWLCIKVSLDFCYRSWKSVRLLHQRGGCKILSGLSV